MADEPNQPFFNEGKGELYRSIIEFLSPTDGTATSSAKLAEELEWDSADVQSAVKELIAFGELELINVSQYGRVRLREPTPSTKEQTFLTDVNQSVWHAYITEEDGVGRTRARRLFDNREAGEEHLKHFANVDTLTPVPGLSEVWCDFVLGYGKQEYAVLRSDPVFRQADDPHPY